MKQVAILLLVLISCTPMTAQDKPNNVIFLADDLGCDKSGGQLDSHFGLGKAANKDVTVILPSGKPITVADIKADQYLELDLKSNNSTKVLQP